MAKKKVLLVDDEVNFLEIMAQRIESWGFDVIAVSNGKEAIHAVEGKKPDIVILDYMMPEMDGVSTLEEIRKIDGKVPVIMFTAHSDNRSIEGTDRLAVSAFIPKLSPFVDAQASLRTTLDLMSKKKEKKDG